MTHLYKVLPLALALNVAFSSHSIAAVDLMIDDAQELRGLYDSGDYTHKQTNNKQAAARDQQGFTSKKMLLLERYKRQNENATPSPAQAAIDPVFTSSDDVKATLTALGRAAAADTPTPTALSNHEIEAILSRIGTTEKTETPAQGTLQGLIFVASEDAIDNADVFKLYKAQKHLTDAQFQPIGITHKNLENALSHAAESLDMLIGQPISLELIENATARVKTYIRDTEMPFANVYIPPQDVKEGVIFIVVKSAVAEDIRIANSDHFNEARILSKIRQDLGTPIDIQALEDDVALLSSHPDRSVTAAFVAGQSDNATVIELDIEEQKPWSLFAGLSNTGSADLDKQQISLGGTHRNLWGIDHEGAYQYSTSKDLESLKAHSFNYKLPYYRNNALAFSYARSSVTSTILDNTFKTTGRFSQAGLHHHTQWPRARNLGGDWTAEAQRVSLGVDRKKIDGDVLFTLFGEPLDTGLGADVDVFNIVLGYNGIIADPYKGQTQIKGTATYSPGSIDGKNNDEDFETARENTNAKYAHLKFEADRRMPLNLPKIEKAFSLNTGIKAQYSNSRLIGSERFVNAPTKGARGYNSSIFSGDTGAMGYVELETDFYTLITSAHYNDALQGRIFTDFGTFYNNSPTDTETLRDSMISVGAGATYIINDKLSSTLTYAQDLSGQPNDTAQKLLYQMIIKY